MFVAQEAFRVCAKSQKRELSGLAARGESVPKARFIGEKGCGELRE
jgi:hypothetical protein